MPMPLSLPTFLLSPRWRAAPEFALRGVIALVSLILCWQLAGLLTQLGAGSASAPALRQARPSPVDHSSGRAALTHWLASPEAAEAPRSIEGLQLIAVITGPRGVAVIGGIEPNPIALAVGQDARPGLKLVDVQASQVIFEQAGARRELAFPQKAETALINAPTKATPANAAPGKPRGRPAASALTPPSTRRIARGQLAGLAQSGNLGDWDKGLSLFPNGGIRIDNADKQALSKPLNLRSGDIIQQVNGQPLAQLGDISLIYHHFSQSPEVTLNILRDGKPQQLHYTIQP